MCVCVCLIVLLKYTWHILLIHKVYNLMFWQMPEIMSYMYSIQAMNVSITSKWFLMTYVIPSPRPFPSDSHWPAFCYSIPISLHSLEFYVSRNIQYVLCFYVVSLTLHNYFEIYTCCCINIHASFLLRIFHCTDMPHFLNQSPIARHSDCFPFGAIKN